MWLLLMKAGDIESNPGPGKEYSLYILDLNKKHQKKLDLISYILGISNKYKSTLDDVQSAKAISLATCIIPFVKFLFELFQSQN